LLVLGIGFVLHKKFWERVEERGEKSKCKRQRAKLRSPDVVGMDVLIGGWGFGEFGLVGEGEGWRRGGREAGRGARGVGGLIIDD